MLRATTLVHKGAMEIAIHSIRSFANHFSSTYLLTIHTDTSTDEEDHRLLLEAANGMQATLVTPKDRAAKINQLLASYPNTKKFVHLGGFYTKLQIPVFEESPYFFFDSDIIWLRPVVNLQPTNALNAFSTESWTWYHGIAKKNLWIKANTPRRVNSGFQFIGQSFPFEKMEDMLAKEMFNPTKYAGDQEIFAYLYNNMNYYHPQDLKRSRNAVVYHLAEDSCAALHFPGRMWQKHTDQLGQLVYLTKRSPVEINYLPPVPLSNFELMRMNIRTAIGESKLLAKPLNLIRKVLRPAS